MIERDNCAHSLCLQIGRSLGPRVWDHQPLYWQVLRGGDPGTGSCFWSWHKSMNQSSLNTSYFKSLLIISENPRYSHDWRANVSLCLQSFDINVLQYCVPIPGRGLVPCLVPMVQPHLMVGYCSWEHWTGMWTVGVWVSDIWTNSDYCPPPQVHSRTIPKSLCTIPTLEMVMPLLILDGQAGLDQSLVILQTIYFHHSLPTLIWRCFLWEDSYLRDWSVFSRRYFRKGIEIWHPLHSECVVLPLDRFFACQLFSSLISLLVYLEGYSSVWR